MRLQRVCAARLAALTVVAAATLFMAACSSGGNGHDIPLPVITISPVSASVHVGDSLQFTATIVSFTSTTVTWSVNGILGGNTTLGTVNSSGFYTAPATVPNPATVTVKCTSSAESSPSGSAIVTVTPMPVNTTVSISPIESSALAGSTVQFTATVTGNPDTVVSWSVNGVAGGSSSVGTISSSGAYTSPASAPNTPTVVITATSQADSTQFASTTLTLTSSNSAPLYVNFGLNGDTGNPSTDYYNGLFTSVAVCLPGTPDCQTIPNILVDTGSIGLRVLNSALTTVPATELGTITDSQQNQVQECIQFGDGSYTWGPIFMADVGIGGEKALSVPIQVLGDTTFTVPTPSCLSLGVGPNLNTVAALGANGILGVGTSIQDCGLNCAGGQTFTPYPYYVCPKNACQVTAVPIAQQVSNPVAFFPKDNNGVELSLPSIPTAGAPSLPFANSDGTGLVPAGLLVLGVATEANNALGSATVYALDAHGNLPTVTYNGTPYDSAGFVDTGSNALYVLDAQTLGIPSCSDDFYYCPSSPLSLVLNIADLNNNTGTVDLNIANADMQFASSPGFSAFDNLGGPSGDGLSTDYFDLGVPFVFGRTVFVGIAGTTVPGNGNAPNGYLAF